MRGTRLIHAGLLALFLGGPQGVEAAPVSFSVSIATFSGDEGASGSFVVDPALAAPAGESNVPLDAFSLTIEAAAISGDLAPPLADDLTLTLADLSNPLAARAQFQDGVFESLNILSTGTSLPGFDELFLDIQPVGVIGASDVQFELSRGGTFARVLGTASYRGPLAPVPEPSEVILFLVGGALVLAACTDRRGRSKLVESRSSEDQAHLVP